jgi:hypothetical protein
MLNVFVLDDLMLDVFMLDDFILSVMAPFKPLKEKKF